ncbi:MAG: hypothetical protein H6734_16100 [Alphaproteobacteria bacterium]|nr:hypothetical protein [Alphaproteobacteria bacterium]
MSAHDDTFGKRPAWVALLTLPTVLLLLSMAQQLVPPHLGAPPMSFTAMGLGPVPEPIWAELAGIVGAALCAVVVGPHLTAVGALLTLACTFVATNFLPMPFLMDALLPLVANASMVGVVASMGASSGGGAPGLRYAVFMAGWAAWVAAPFVAQLLVTTLAGAIPFGVLGSGLATAAGILMMVPTLSWWFTKKHPRPAAADATYRVAGTAGVAFAILIAVYAVDLLRVGHLPGYAGYTGFYGSLPTLLHAGAAISTASALALLAVVLQVVRSPSRLGVLAGAGCLLVSLAGVWAWSARGEWLALISPLAGMGQAMVLPWVWARATSDAHWRATGALAAVVLFAPHTVEAMGTLLPIACMMTLALAAIPVGALGWFGDDWVYGDVPGSELQRRGRRR